MNPDPLMGRCAGCEWYDQEYDDCKCEGQCATCSKNECRGCPHYRVIPLGDGAYNVDCELDWRKCDREVSQ